MCKEVSVKILGLPPGPFSACNIDRLGKGLGQEANTFKLREVPPGDSM